MPDCCPHAPHTCVMQDLQRPQRHRQRPGGLRRQPHRQRPPAPLLRSRLRPRPHTRRRHAAAGPKRRCDVAACECVWRVPWCKCVFGASACWGVGPATTWQWQMNVLERTKLRTGLPVLPACPPACLHACTSLLLALKGHLCPRRPAPLPPLPAALSPRAHVSTPTATHTGYGRPQLHAGMAGSRSGGVRRSADFSSALSACGSRLGAGAFAGAPVLACRACCAWHPACCACRAWHPACCACRAWHPACCGCRGCRGCRGCCRCRT